MLDIVWKLLPLWLVVPGLGIWLYLRDAGWESLFLDAVVSWSGLGVLLAAGVLGCLLPTLFIVSPALIFFGGLRDTLADRAARGAFLSDGPRGGDDDAGLAGGAGRRARPDRRDRALDAGRRHRGYLLAGGVLCLGACCWPRCSRASLCGASGRWRKPALAVGWPAPRGWERR
ncbi:hypothetical protein WJ972_17845 [Achromobacter insuavis]